MAKYKSHISFSLFVSAAYACAGLFLFSIYPEYVLLASIIVVIAGLLPDIDSGSGGPANEISGLLAAVSPIVLLELVPAVKDGGVARVALVVICCYLLTRILIIRLLKLCTNHRGMIHSIPAAILTFECLYMLFWDLFWVDRLYISLAGLIGFTAHLLLDAYSNLDIVGRITGQKSSGSASIKFFGNSIGANLALYVPTIVLGVIVFRDLYPHLN